MGEDRAAGWHRPRTEFRVTGEIDTAMPASFEGLVNSGLEMPVTTAKEAKAAGLRFYWSGKPCARGHHSKRRVDSGICAACACLKNKEQSNLALQRRRALREEKLLQKATESVTPRDKQKLLEVYAETADLERAAGAINLSLSELNVKISKSTSLASAIYALEKRLKVTNNDVLIPKYKPAEVEWTPKSKATFIRAYIDTGDIATARAAIGASPSTLNDELESDPEFAEQVEIARPKAEQALEEKAIQLALAGNDKLLTVILKAKKPEYRDKITIDQTTTIKQDDAQINARINQLLNKYGAIDAEFTELKPASIGTDEQKGSGRTPSSSGRIGTETVVQQAPVYVSGNG